jgi:hypothetical protein
MMKRQADNDNRRWTQRTRADEQFILIGVLLGCMVLFSAAMWLAS